MEVSDSTLGFDRGEKLKLYARHGLSIYWIVNLAEGVLEIYREPAGETYAEKRTCRSGDEVTPPYTDTPLPVAELLG